MLIQKVKYCVLALSLVACTLVYGADSIHNATVYQVRNMCNHKVSGVAIGDLVCLLRYEGGVYATYLAGSGDIAPGHSLDLMSCADRSSRSAKIIFVPPAGIGMQAVSVDVREGASVSLPKAFCAIPELVNTRPNMKALRVKPKQ